MPRKLKKKPKSEKTKVGVLLTPEERERAERLAESESCTIAELFRRALETHEQHRNLPTTTTDLILQGDQLTRMAKTRALQAFSQMQGIPRAANAAGVTQATIYNWLEHDPVFRTQAEECKNYAIDQVEGMLARTARKGNVTAMLAILNAHHPDYGQIRTQLLQRVLNPFLDRIVKLASQFIQPGDLKRFIEELTRDAESVIIEATARGR